MFVITLSPDAEPSGPTWKIRLPIASKSGMLGVSTASSPPTMTVISPDAARCTPPVTGASSVAIPRSSRERREPHELVAVVRAHVDPRAAVPQRREHSVAARDDVGDDCGRRKTRDDRVGSASGLCAGEPPRLRTSPRADERPPVASWTTTIEPRLQRGSPRGARPGARRPTKPTRISRRRGVCRRQMEVVSVVRMSQRDLLVELDAEPRFRRGNHVPVLPPNRPAAGSRRGSRPSVRCPRGSRKFGLQAASWMFAAPTTGPQYRCGAICA